MKRDFQTPLCQLHLRHIVLQAIPRVVVVLVSGDSEGEETWAMRRVENMALR